MLEQRSGRPDAEKGTRIDFVGRRKGAAHRFRCIPHQWNRKSSRPSSAPHPSPTPSPATLPCPCPHIQSLPPAPTPFCLLSPVSCLLPFPPIFLSTKPPLVGIPISVPRSLGAAYKGETMLASLHLIADPLQHPTRSPWFAIQKNFPLHFFASVYLINTYAVGAVQPRYSSGPVQRQRRDSSGLAPVQFRSSSSSPVRPLCLLPTTYSHATQCHTATPHHAPPHRPFVSIRVHSWIPFLIFPKTRQFPTKPDTPTRPPHSPVAHQML